MTAYTGRLIAHARGLVTTIRVAPPTEAQINSAFAQYETIALALADALEAAEALHRGQRAAKMDALARAEAAEAQRDTLAEAAQAALGVLYALPKSAMSVRRGRVLAQLREALAGVAQPDPREDVLAALRDGPRSSEQLRVDTGLLRAMEADGLVKFDDDPYPNEFVPGNPLIVRLPDDARSWPGWKAWNR